MPSIAFAKSSRRLAPALALLAALACAACAGEPARLPALPAGSHVLFVGDSVTAGSSAPFGFMSLVRQAWQEQRPDVAVTFDRIGAWAAPSQKLRDIVPKIVADKKKPTLVIIFFGLNDSNHKSPQEQYAENLRFAVEELRRAQIASAICTLSVWRTLAKTAPYSQTARQTAEALGVPVIDLHAAFDGYLRSVRPIAADAQPTLDGLPTTVDPTADGVHLGAIGNRLVASAVLAAMGVKPTWQKHVVHVALGNPDRNLGYGPRGKAKITLAPQKDFYADGEQVTLSVEPEPGFVFDGWRGSIEAKEPTTTFTVQASTFIQAVVRAEGDTRGKR